MNGFAKRTHKCGEISRKDVGQQVLLYGWVHRVRDKGGVLFVDLRDVAGVVQVVFELSASKQALENATKLRSEYVIKIVGKVRVRPATEDGRSTFNADLTTGEVEVAADQVEILNHSEPLPFSIADDGPVSDLVRLKYRYLDLRRPEQQKKLLFRSKFINHCRNYMDRFDFVEVETPILTKSTPEGARDFLVPSRLQHGNFYALPQSPQLFKQILMVAGFDRYYQVCRCFRDEDLRADRQPEFTQLDIETSFTSPDDFFEIMEGLFQEAAPKFGFTVPKPFPRLTYAEAMGRYGSDKPDTRFGLELVDLSDLAKGCGFKVFDAALESGGQVKTLVVPGGGEFARSEIDNIVEHSKDFGAKGLAWAKVGEGLAVTSTIAKFIPTETFSKFVERSAAKPGDLMLFVADRAKVVASTLGGLRLELGKRLKLIDDTKWNFLWVTDFPWLEWDEEEKRFNAMHHPFTKPNLEDMEKHKADPGKIRAQAYDMVLNGSEIGGGSVRIHSPQLQEKMFDFLNINKDEARSKFGFLLDALAFGAPPHAGMALGIDRITAILQHEPSLREVIAFPKTQRGQCLMTEAPSAVAEKQLNELKIKLKE